jgi:hypothetical protein
MFTTIPNLLAIAILACVFTNGLHLYIRGGGQFLYYPASGWLRVLFFTWILSVAVSAVLFELSILPFSAVLGLGVGLTCTQQIYSLLRRSHRLVMPDQGLA